MEKILPADKAIHNLLTVKLLDLEELFESDILTHYGPIYEADDSGILKIVEELANDKDKRERLTIILTTEGGSATAVERYVNIIRKHYKEINFIIPDYAYSAGTIFCMSGDNIYMDYYSVLGPIDPQVRNKEGNFVPAFGYLDKVNEMIKKAKDGDLTEAEFLIFKDIDLAEIRAYEQAKELTIALLKKWLVKYKFKNWTTHKTNPKLKGKKVTMNEKEERAEFIADRLSDNNIWKSHGRPINIEALNKELRLIIIDYGEDTNMKTLIRSYHDLLSDYVLKNKSPIFVHTRRHI